jgi:hypothetical protein
MKTKADPYEIIKKELSNYDTSVLVEFMDKFPPTTRTYFLPIYKIGKIKPIKILVKCQQVGMTTMFSATWLPNYLQLPSKSKVTKKYVIFGSVDDFWKRWNRFRKIIAFL